MTSYLVCGLSACPTVLVLQGWEQSGPWGLPPLRMGPELNSSGRMGWVAKGSYSPKPDVPNLVLCCCPPPALASQTTAACGESGWSLRGWAQVLGREGGGGEEAEGCPNPLSLASWPSPIGGPLLLPSVPQEVNSYDHEGMGG